MVDNHLPHCLRTLLRDEATAVLSGLIGGARYGMRIRLPHAFVMTMLFRHDLMFKEKVRGILKLTAEHTSNLACFVALYKLVLATLKMASRMLKNSEEEQKQSVCLWIGRMIARMIVDGPIALHGKDDDGLDMPQPPGFPERIYHSLVAGSFGGYVIWGKFSSINYQILLYLSGRVVVGVWKRLFKNDAISNSPRFYRLASAAIWGIVMMLFEESPHVLHPSLKSSMDEIYRFRLQS